MIKPTLILFLLISFISCKNDPDLIKVGEIEYWRISNEQVTINLSDYLNYEDLTTTIDTIYSSNKTPVILLKTNHTNYKIFPLENPINPTFPIPILKKSHIISIEDNLNYYNDSLIDIKSINTNFIKKFERNNDTRIEIEVAQNERIHDLDKLLLRLVESSQDSTIKKPIIISFRNKKLAKHKSKTEKRIVYVFHADIPKPIMEYQLVISDNDSITEYSYRNLTNEQRNMEFSYNKESEQLSFGFDKYILSEKIEYQNNEIQESSFGNYILKDSYDDATGPLLFNPEYGILGIGNILGPQFVLLPNSKPELTKEVINQLCK